MSYTEILSYVNDVKQRALQTVDQANAMARNTFDVILEQKVLSDSTVTRPIYQINDPNYQAGDFESEIDITVDVEPMDVTDIETNIDVTTFEPKVDFGIIEFKNEIERIDKPFDITLDPNKVSDLNEISFEATKPLISSVDIQKVTINPQDIKSYVVTDLQPFTPLTVITQTKPKKMEIEDFELEATLDPFDNKTNNDYVWKGAGASNLMTAIMSIVNSGGLGVTGPYTQAIFNEDRERKLQTLNDALMIIASKTGARGFRRVTSMTAAQENELILKYQFDQEQLSRNIIKTVEEHMRNNIQVAIQNGNTLEKMHMDFANAYDKLFTDMAIAVVNRYKARIECEVAIFTAKTEVLKTNAYLYKMQAEVEQIRRTMELSEYDASISKHKAEIEEYKAYMSGLQLEVDAIKANTDVYKTLTDTEMAKWKLDLEQREFQIEQYKLDILYMEKQLQLALENDNRLKTQYEMDLKEWNSELDLYKTDLEQYKSYITGIESKLKNVGNALDFEKTEIQRYTASLQQHQNRVTAFRAEIEAYNAKLSKDRQEEFKVGLRKDEFNLGLDEMKNVIGKLAQEVEFAKTSAELALKSATESGTIGVNAIAQSGKVVSELAKALTGSEINLNTRKLTS